MRKLIRFWYFEIFGIFLPAIFWHVVAVILMYAATVALFMPYELF
jgi:hypothetical protein